VKDFINKTFNLMGSQGIFPLSSTAADGGIKINSVVMLSGLIVMEINKKVGLTIISWLNNIMRMLMNIFIMMSI